ncbi:MAG TPA: LamG-like jellyroll fold domain-containing protein [Parafilimonas sp.]|nr:LamG-like jellyroll fold domain-containing protein [Parafilimonas sp.]
MKTFTKTVLFVATFFVCNNASSQYTYHCGGYLLHCHGLNGFVDAEDPIYYSQSITIAAWVRCESKHPSNMGIVYRSFFVNQGASTRVEWGIVLNASGEFMFKGAIDTSDGVGFEPSIQPEIDSLSSGVVPDSGKFYHIAVTLDQSSYMCNFYVNGVVVTSKKMRGGLHWATALGGNFNDASIGCHSQYYQNKMYTDSYFNGYIDDVFMSPDVINKSQLDSVANGTDLTSLNDFFYHFNEGTGGYTYSNPGAIYNNLNYGNTGYLIGDVAWVTNDPCPPFPVSFVDPYPSMVKDDGTLNTDVSKIDTTKKVIGAATDGLSKVLVIAKTAPNVKVQFLIQGSENGFLSNLDQSVTNQPYVNVMSNSDGYAVGVYTAPDGYGSSFPLGGRNLTVWAFSYDNPNNPNAYTTSSKNLQLVTPPVVLVHGMWSNPQVWEKNSNGNPSFLKYLTDVGFTNIHRADYSAESSNTFDPVNPESIFGRKAILKAINDGITQYEMQGIVTCQADVVGHSLGGLMTRSFSQWDSKNFVAENYKQGFIHKLITLGTPHLGSPLGPILYNNIAPIHLPSTLYSIRDLLNGTSMQVGSCHRDFNPDISNNPALQHLKATNDNKINKVFAVVGIASASQSTAMNDFLYALGEISTSSLFEDLNDLVVSRKSQLGGLTGTGTGNFQYTAHSDPPGRTFAISNTETDNPAIFSQVANLLQSSDASLFAPYFPAPLDAVSGFTNGNDDKNKETGSMGMTGQMIRVDSASRNLVFKGGVQNDITITYDSSETSKLNNVICMIQDLGWFAFDTSNSLNITLPGNFGSIGKINFALLARDSSGVLIGDTASFTIVPNGTFLKLQVNPSIIELDSSIREESLQCTALYKIGTDTADYDINDTTNGITYTPLYNRVAIDGNGVVRASEAGSDTILVSYLSDTIKVPVLVDSNFEKAVLYPNTIDFAAIPDKIIGDSPFALIASASSGENVKFKVVSGPAKIENGIAILTGTGTVTIKATAVGNVYFAGAKPVTRSFVVSGVLASQLLNFSAFLINDNVELSWQTAQEQNTSYFDVEKSTDGIYFSSIGKVQSKGTSITKTNYSLTDNSIELNTPFAYYRLMQVDKDGKSLFSNTVIVKFDGQSNSLSIMPNPVKNNLSFRLEGYRGNATMLIFDMNGRQVYKNDVTIGSGNINILTNFLRAGSYLLQIKTNNSVWRKEFLKE